MLPRRTCGKGESFYQSAVREVKEETGLIISRLHYCGVIDWCNVETGKRYLVFLYKTSCYQGELIEQTEEGINFWGSVEEISALQCAPQFEEYLPLFLKDQVCEGYRPYNDICNFPMEIYKEI